MTDKELYQKFHTNVKEKNPEWGDGKVGAAAKDIFLRHKILNDLYYFGSEVLGWKDAKHKRFPKKKRLCPRIHKELARILQKEEDKAIFWPRLHLKSTWVKARIVQRVLQDPNVRIALVTETLSLARAELADIKNMLSHPVILKLFPDVVPRPGENYRNWETANADHITTSRKTVVGKKAQEAQVTAISVGQRITGFHFDEAYADDIIGPESVFTGEQMIKREDWWAYFQSIMEVGALITITGTFYHYNDLYNKMIREKQFKNVYIRKAIEKGKVIYDTWFSKKDLEKIRKRQGEYIFNCQYMLNPMPDSTKIIPGPYPIYNVTPQGEKTFYIAVDPAGTAKQHSDDSGFAVGFVDSEDRLWIEECFGAKLTHDPKADRSFSDVLIQKVIQYGPKRVGIEYGVMETIKYIVEAKVAKWEAHNNDKKALAPLRNMTAIPIPNNQSKAQRVSLGLGSFIREGRAYIHSRCTGLISQLERFTGKAGDADDMIDAANMLLFLHDRFAARYSVPKNFRRGGLTYQDVWKLSQPEDSWERRFVS